MSRKRDKFTRELEQMMNTAFMPALQEIEQKRQKAQAKARAEVNRRLRNRDAIPEQRPAKPLEGQLSLFGNAEEVL
jgi:hypothetical protein